MRFIEAMPLGGGEAGARRARRLVPTAETRARIAAALGPLVPLPPPRRRRRVREPSRCSAARGVVGFISPVTEPYCGTCNRMRLTADGRFHLCLLNDDELDIRAALGAGADTTAIGGLLLRAVRHKPAGHLLAIGRSTEERSMHQIGG